MSVALTPRWRPTARVFVVDPRERVLLFCGAGTGGTIWWFTPGGGVRRGESLAAAAIRELREETGITVTEAELGPLVATSAGTWAAIDGKRPHFSADSFYFLRVPDADVDTGGQDDEERAYLAGYRWWTLDEVRTATEPVWPRGLADMVAVLLSDGAPPRPVRLPWA